MQQEANKGNWQRSDSIQFFVLFSNFFASRFKLSTFSLSQGGGRVKKGARPHSHAKIVTLFRSKVAYLIKITRSGKHSRDRIVSRPILHNGKAVNLVSTLINIPMPSTTAVNEQVTMEAWHHRAFQATTNTRSTTAPPTDHQWLIRHTMGLLITEKNSILWLCLWLGRQILMFVSRGGVSAVLKKSQGQWRVLTDCKPGVRRGR